MAKSQFLVSDRVRFEFKTEPGFYTESYHLSDEDLAELASFSGAEGTIVAIEEYDDETYSNHTVEFDFPCPVDTDFIDGELHLVHRPHPTVS